MDGLTRRQLLLRGAGLAIGAVPLADAVASAAASPSGIFRELARSLRGDVVQRGAPGYNSARLVYDTRFDGVKPQAVVFCESLGDVQKTVRWARKHGVHLVARSGGHSYGGYSTTTGVVVDVSRLHALSLADGRVAVGAGARLGNVYGALANHGRMIPAGTCPTVGIAGLAQGGGIGMSSRKFGLTCDNVLAATVVLADGSAVVASAAEHPDLYWALRGAGGGNFGLVTRFVFRTHPAANVATYSMEWPWTDAHRVIQAWQSFAPHAPDGFFSVLNVSAAAGSSGSPQITSAGQFYGSEQALRSLLDPLVNAGTPTRLTVRSRTFLDAVGYWAGGGGGRARFAAKSSIANRSLPSAGIDALIHQLETRRTTGSGSGTVLLDTWGGAINRVPKSRSAFVHRDALFSFQYLAYWNAATAAAPNLAWLARRWSAMRPYVSPFAYQNYIDPALPNWQHAYYGSNLPRLQQLKRKYDPQNFFHFRQSIRLPH